MKDLAVPNIKKDYEAIRFCRDFESSRSPKFILGCNEFGESIAKHTNIHGFIDDFTSSREFSGRPIVRSNQIPRNSMVVIAAVGRPFTAKKSLAATGADLLDYFSFHKYSKLPTLPVWFFNDFKNDFKTNFEKFNSVFKKLSDDISRETFQKIINFRLSDDLSHMTEFTDRQNEQYFEDFLQLEKNGEIFVDVGAFDGFTSQVFINHCPNYRKIHIFEPEPNNIKIAKENLKKFSNICFHHLGLSDSTKTLKIKSDAQSSKISPDGDTEVNLVKLDDYLNSDYTFLKMDIEGGEVDAINGAIHSIEKYHPKLALSVYHKSNDFWQIPEAVFKARSDYTLYMRHYLEGISETVLYFIPT